MRNEEQRMNAEEMMEMMETTEVSQGNNYAYCTAALKNDGSGTYDLTVVYGFVPTDHNSVEDGMSIDVCFENANTEAANYFTFNGGETQWAVTQGASEVLMPNYIRAKSVYRFTFAAAAGAFVCQRGAIAATNGYGVTMLEDSTNSTSNAVAATAGAVKQTYDLAVAAIPASEKGIAGGVATLGTDGKVPEAQLPDSELSCYAYCTGDDSTEAGSFNLTVLKGALEMNGAKPVDGMCLDVYFPSGMPSGIYEFSFDGGVTAFAVESSNGRTVPNGYAATGSVLRFLYVDSASAFLCDRSAPATSTQYGIVKLNSTTTSTSNAVAATAGAVKQAYDLASGAQAAANNAQTAANNAQATANNAQTAANAAQSRADSAYNLADAKTMTPLDCWPVGSIYLSYDHVSPEDRFGGTWERIASGQFLLGAAAGDTIGSTGGEEKHKLTAAEMPSHTHDGIYYKSNNVPINLSSGQTAYKMQWTAKGTGISGTELRTGAAGGIEPHNNMPPYIRVSIWRRKQ